MIYEFRTYDLKPRAVPIFEERMAESLPGRLKLSPLGGFWSSEIGPLNQVVHIWPYNDMNERTDIRAKAAAVPNWPPNNNDIMENMQTEIFIPAPFMTPLGDRNIGPIYEMRTYKYEPGAIPQVLEAWGARIEEREKYSPLAGAWHSEIGGLNLWVHLWAYTSMDERARVRAETREKGVWPPPGSATPIQQENKILTPFSFSPMQ